MSNYIVGSSSIIGAHKEGTFNQLYDNDWTNRPQSDAIRMTSESLKATYNKLDEGVLMASKTQPEQDLGSVSVSGDVDTVLNPSFIDWLMKATLGKDDMVENPSTGDPEPAVKVTVGTKTEGGSTYDVYYTDVTYTLADPNEVLPSSALELWRGNQGFYYSGMTVSSLSMEAPSQDFVKGSISFSGTKESYLGSDASASYVGSPASEGSYKCTKAKLRPANANSDQLANFFTAGRVDWDSCPINEIYDVETSTLTIDNGIEQIPATYCSGLYGKQPSHGQRSVTLNCSVPYNDSFEDFRQQYYASENPDKLALLLQFASKDTLTYTLTGETTPTTSYMHQVFVILPNVSISDMSANASGEGLIDGSFSGIALSVGLTEPIKVIVRDYNYGDQEAGPMYRTKTYDESAATDTWTFDDCMTSADATNYRGFYRDLSDAGLLAKTVNADDVIFYITTPRNHAANLPLASYDELQDILSITHVTLDDGDTAQGTGSLYNWTYDFEKVVGQGMNETFLFVLGRVKSGIVEDSASDLRPSDFEELAICAATFTAQDN